LGPLFFGFEREMVNLGAWRIRSSNDRERILPLVGFDRAKGVELANSNPAT
jgi:hypothetical protein